MSLLPSISNLPSTVYKTLEGVHYVMFLRIVIHKKKPVIISTRKEFINEESPNILNHLTLLNYQITLMWITIVIDFFVNN